MRFLIILAALAALVACGMEEETPDGPHAEFDRDARYAYTQGLGAEVRSSYATDGLTETVERLNNPDPTKYLVFIEDGWHQFIIDRYGQVIAHTDPPLIGKTSEDVLGPNAPELSEFSEDGQWHNSGLNLIWVERAHGYLFGAVWRDAWKKE